MHRTTQRTLLAALLLPALAACEDKDGPALVADGGADRIIAPQVADAVAGKALDEPGIVLDVAGQRHHAATGVQTGFRNSGDGFLMMSLEASRIEGQAAFKTKVVIHQMVAEQGTQDLGDDASGQPYVEVTGVPGHAGTLRSIDGELNVVSLALSESKLPTAGHTEFTGRFVPVDAAGATQSSAAPVELSGELRIKSSW